MSTPFRRALARAFYWQHPRAGGLALPLLAAFVFWVTRQLSPLASMPGNNHAAALGVLTAGAGGLLYIAIRLIRYALARGRGGLADGAPRWHQALMDATRCATVIVLVVLLLLAPLLGRQGFPLVTLGYTEPFRWFTVGLLATLAGCALVCPAWTLVRPPRRVLPFVPPHPDQGP